MLLSIGLLLALQDEPSEVPSLRQVQFVILKSPSEMPEMQSQEAMQALQVGHVEFLQGLWEKRVALAVGPIVGRDALRGIVVIDSDSPEQAGAILANDPLVKAGYLEPEIHTWMCDADVMQKGDDFMDMVPIQLGLLYRREDAEELPQERVAEIQQGHMAHINRMAEAGVLVSAGPIIGASPFRGIFIFEGIDADEAIAWVADDPTIKEGRLEMRLHSWFVAKGTFTRS